MTHKRLTKRAKAARIRANGDAVAAIYDRAGQRGSEDYLTINQPTTAETTARLIGESAERRAKKAARRLANWTGGQLAPDAFCLTTPDGQCISTDPRCMHQPKEVA